MLHGISGKQKQYCSAKIVDLQADSDHVHDHSTVKLNYGKVRKSAQALSELFSMSKTCTDFYPFRIEILSGRVFRTFHCAASAEESREMRKDNPTN